MACFQPSGIVFDLDGTLIDSKADLAASANHVLECLGLPQRAEEEVQQYVGGGLERLVSRLLASSPNQELPMSLDEMLQRGVPFFRDHYWEHCLDRTRLYPGTKEVLQELKPLPLFVLTNKNLNFSLKILKGLNVLNQFQAVFGSDSFEEKKPSPMGLQHIANSYNLELERLVMVGDSDKDLGAAQNAGCPAIFCTYGMGEPEGVPFHGQINDISELPTKLNNLNLA